MVSMYLLVLFLIFPFHLSFNLAVPRLTQLKSLSQRASTTLTLFSLAIRLARWIWRKVHHRQQYLIFLPLFSVLEHHCFIIYFFSFWVFNSGRLLLEHQCLKKCLNWTLDWMCGTQLFMHIQCNLQISFKFCCELWYQYLVKYMYVGLAYVCSTYIFILVYLICVFQLGLCMTLDPCCLIVTLSLSQKAEYFVMLSYLGFVWMIFAVFYRQTLALGIIIII